MFSLLLFERDGPVVFWVECLVPALVRVRKARVRKAAGPQTKLKTVVTLLPELVGALVLVRCAVDVWLIGQDQTGAASQ
jgi:hypothetical protein